jgi:hypothetical protein
VPIDVSVAEPLSLSDRAGFLSLLSDASQPFEPLGGKEKLAADGLALAHHRKVPTPFGQIL